MLFLVIQAQIFKPNNSRADINVSLIVEEIKLN